MEEIDQQGLLDMFKGYPVGERVILGHFGTVQTLLAQIFGTPVSVQLVDQKTNAAGVIVRRVHLMAGDRMLGAATSFIPKERNLPEVLADISAGKLGLGQIVYKHGLSNRRRLLDIQRSVSDFSRRYVIEGPEIYLEIFEAFLRKPFLEIGWV